MPIPPFAEGGLLPPGLHRASLDAIADRFGTGAGAREELTARLQRLVGLARHVQARRLLVDGSFVTSKPEPNDLDVVVWLDLGYLHMLDEEDATAQTLEWMIVTRSPDDVFAVYNESGWNQWVDFFSQVRGNETQRKGVVEVEL